MALQDSDEVRVMQGGNFSPPVDNVGMVKKKLVPTNRFRQIRQYNRKNQRKPMRKNGVKKNIFLDFWPGSHRKNLPELID